MSAGAIVFVIYAVAIPLVALSPLLNRRYRAMARRDRRAKAQAELDAANAALYREANSTRRLSAVRDWLTIIAVGLVAAAFYVGIIYDLP